MADNTVLNTGSGGDTYASDDIGGIKFSRIKVVHGVDGTNDGDVSRTNALPVTPGASTRTDTSTGTGAGTAVDVTLSPMKNFALQVTGTGAITSWTVNLEGSLDGTTYTVIMAHSKAANGDGATIWNPTSIPCRYFRSNVSALVVGPGTNVIARILGMN